MLCDSSLTGAKDMAAITLRLYRGEASARAGFVPASAQGKLLPGAHQIRRPGDMK